jgi:hypothetical protein
MAKARRGAVKVEWRSLLALRPECRPDDAPSTGCRAGLIELAQNGSQRVFDRRRPVAANVALPWIEQERIGLGPARRIGVPPKQSDARELARAGL